MSFVAPAYLSELPRREAERHERATGATTLFYGALGSNIVWGFNHPAGRPGVAISDGNGSQVVVNLDALRELVRLVAEGLTTGQKAAELGLERCHFNAAKAGDCDLCCSACPGDEIWVKMAGSYEGSTPEAEYYACSKCVESKHAGELWIP